MDLSQWLERLQALPDGLLYAALFVAALLENLLPPLPGDAVVLFGAWLAGRGRLAWPLTFALVTLGSWCGFMAYYGLGRWLGHHGVHALLGRWFQPRRLARGEAWVRRYGLWVVLLNRLLAGARSVISLAAGFVELPVLPVAVLALLSSVVWHALLVSAGWWVGEEWQRVLHLMEAYNRTVLAALAVVAVAFALRLWRARARD